MIICTIQGSAPQHWNLCERIPPPSVHRINPIWLLISPMQLNLLHMNNWWAGSCKTRIWAAVWLYNRWERRHGEYGSYSYCSSVWAKDARIWVSLIPHSALQYNMHPNLNTVFLSTQIMLWSWIVFLFSFSTLIRSCFLSGCVFWANYKRLKTHFSHRK